VFLPFLNWQLGCAAMHAHELDACMGEDGGGVAFRSRHFLLLNLVIFALNYVLVLI